MQTLILENGQVFQCDRMFANGGSPREYSMSGNQRILLREGVPPKPDIFQRGPEFFFKNGVFVEKAEDVEALPEPYRQQALTFITRQRQKGIKAPRTVTMPKRLRVQTPSPGKGVVSHLDTTAAIEEAGRTRD